MLLYNLPGELYMLAADSVESAQALCAGVEKMELAVAHSRETGEYLQKRYGIARCQGCTQAAYLGKEPFPAAQGVEIRPLGQEAFSVVFANYHSFSDPKYIRERLDAGVMRGRLCPGAAAGLHRHAPPRAAWACWRCCRLTRRRGVALALMAAMANHCLERGAGCPSPRFSTGTPPSLELHRRLGWTLCPEKLYWVMD